MILIMIYRIFIEILEKRNGFLDNKLEALNY